MQVVSIIFSVALLGVIIYFVVSPKSSRLHRLAGIIALGLIGLTIGICGIFLIRGPSETAEFVPLPFILDSDPPPPKKGNTAMIITFIVAFLFIAGLVLMSALKEKKKPVEIRKKTDDSKVFQDHDDLEIEQAPDEDDSFNIDLD